MKSLLIKDFKIMMQQKMSLLLFIGISIFMVINGVDLTFCIGYATMLVTILMLGTIAYDEHENGMSFLMTLPISRKQYVLSKYIFTLLGILITDCILLITIGIYKICVPSELLMSEYVMTAVMLFFTAIIMSSFMIPVNFKYGVDKSRLVLLLFAGIISVIGLVFSRFADYVPHGIRTLVAIAAKVTPAMAGIMLGIAALTIFILSLLCSVKIIEHKDY